MWSHLTSSKAAHLTHHTTSRITSHHIASLHMKNHPLSIPFHTRLQIQCWASEGDCHILLITPTYHYWKPRQCLHIKSWRNPFRHNIRQGPIPRAAGQTHASDLHTGGQTRPCSRVQESLTVPAPHFKHTQAIVLCQCLWRLVSN